MKRVILIALSITLLSIPLFAQDEAVISHYGSLKIGGIMQSTFTYNLLEDTVETPQSAFALKRSRLLFWGKILSDNVSYFVQTEGVSSPYVLDTKLIFKNYIPMTSVTIGRFLPNFTFYMPSSTAKLDFINYPLIVSGYAMWRQVGFQTATKTDYVDFNAGVFNGYPKNSTTEENDAKDVLVAGGFKPVEFIKVIGYGWFGNALLSDTLDLASNRYGGGLSFAKPLNEEMSVSIKGEYVVGSDEMVDTLPDHNSAGFYGQIIFRANPQIEILGRYDSFDPNSDVDDDEVTWLTGGLNYLIESNHAKISINYIKKQEATGEYQNDQFVTQFQIFF